MSRNNYIVTIAFNYGRDEASRKVVSGHRSPTAAIRAWLAARTNTGWSPRIECIDDAARARLRDAACLFHERLAIWDATV